MKKLPYVYVRQGTASDPRLSRGNTLALTQLPFAMNGFTLQTRSSGGNWFFDPQDRSLEGIRLTHQPSPWIGDYTPLAFLAERGTAYAKPDERYSFFRPERMDWTPAYLQVYAERYRANMELTPTPCGAKLRLRFDGEEPAALCVFARHPGDAGFELLPDGMTVVGRTSYHFWPTAENFTMYFALRFSVRLDPTRTRCLPEDDAQAGIYIGLSEKQAEVSLAVSYLSVEQALTTLGAEVLPYSFDELRTRAEEQWEEKLGKIELEEHTPEDEKKTFYTCLYRVFLYPRRFHETTLNGETLHFCPDTGRVCTGVKYVDNGFWDTFRTVYPLLSLIDPDAEREILEGFLNTYRDCGWLPKWPSPAEVGMMPGTLIEAVLADAAVKGILTNEQLQTALEAMLKNAEQESGQLRYGRHGTNDYRKYGYIPREKYRESVNHTLDYVYGDFCIAQVLRAAGREKEAERFDASSKNYKKLFDPETGFMRGRDCGGSFAESFSAFSWGGEYCEGGPWQSSFAVYHDIDGLAELYGGRAAFSQKLDELFRTPPVFEVGGYGREIHEMTEMAIADFGQCAISNQPSFHLPWLYAAIGEPEKTEHWLRRLCSEAFSWRENGFPGDDDNGTMSAWYLFARLGFYPLCPGKPDYLGVTPEVSAELHTPQGIYAVQKGVRLPQTLQYREIVKNEEEETA